MEPLIICAALTGGGAPKAHTPYQPVTPKAIAKEALAAWRAGAAIVHCHARREDGTPTNDAQEYRDLLARIRDMGCEAIVNFSAGDNGGLSDHVQRLGVIGAGAEIVSLGGGSFNLAGRTYDNSPSFRRDMATQMLKCGVTPEFELFDLGQIHGLHWLEQQGLLPVQPLVTLGVGIPGALPVELEALQLAIRLLPKEARWSISCQTRDFETFQRIMLCAFAWGGNIRTGLEDCIYVRPGVLARSNEEMVTQWVRMADLWGRPVADATQARQMLKIAVPRVVAPGAA